MNKILAASSFSSFVALLMTASLAVAASATLGAADPLQPGEERWYCVKLPTHGESGWSTRDNFVRLHVEIYSEKDEKDRVNNKDRHRHQFYDLEANPIKHKGIFTATDFGKHQFGYRQRSICVPIHKFARAYYDEQHGWRNASVQIHLMHGGSCPKISMAGRGNNLFKIWRRSGNHVHPFDCGGFRKNIDSVYSGVYNVHEQQKRSRQQGLQVPPQIFYPGADRVDWKLLLRGHHGRTITRFGIIQLYSPPPMNTKGAELKRWERVKPDWDRYTQRQ